MNETYQINMLNRNRDHYTRVTNVLYPFSGLSRIDPVIVADAAERGTKVHKICEGIVKGLGELDVDEEIKGYIESFKTWWEKNPEVLIVEQRFWDDDLELTGQVDLIINTPDGLAIVDLKTSSKPSLTWKAQGCAYAYLAKKAGYDIQKVYFVHLNKVGREPRVYEYPIDDEFFLSIFRVWDHFFKVG